MENLEPVLNQTFLGNPLRAWLLVAGVLLLTVIVSRLVKKVIPTTLGRLTRFTETKIDDMIIHASVGPLTGFVYLGGAYVAFGILDLGKEAGLWVGKSIFIAAAVVIAVIAIRAIDIVFREAVEPWTSRTESKLDDQLVVFGRKLSKIVITALIIASVLDQVGLDIMSLLTGLGLGGLAVALAAQETLGNFLGSVQIMTDHPFTVGDWIRTHGHFGRVVDVGLRSTKIMTRSRIMVVVPNKLIAGNELENVSVGDDLAVDLELGVVYETTADGVELATKTLHEILDAQGGLVQGAHLIHFLSFGDSSLNLKVTYFVSEIDRYWEIQHEVNVAIKRRFDAEGLDFAFPTRTVHVVGAGQIAA